MAKQNNSSNNGMFIGFLIGTVVVGYILGLISIWANNNYLKNVNLGFGDGILLLGLLAGVIYTLMGVAISYAYFKYIKE